MESGEPAR
jgi:hypothetical protein